MKISNRVLETLLCGLVCSIVVFNATAQRWSPVPVNPTSSETLDPSFSYNPTTGIVAIRNAGTNGIADSLPGAAFVGDDYPMVSVLLSFTGVLTSPDVNTDGTNDPIAVLPNFDNGIAWGAPIVFNNKIQLTGSPTSAPGALAISGDPVAILRIDPGFTLADFRAASGDVEIETGYSFGPMIPGGTTFSVGDAAATGAFNIVPEPGSFVLSLGAFLGLAGLRRRR